MVLLQININGINFNFLDLAVMKARLPHGLP